MADIELIIKIPEEKYQTIINHTEEILDESSFIEPKYLYRAVLDGTPLPNIFDLEGLKSDMKALNCGYPYGLDYLLDCLKKRLGITINTESEDKE